MENHPNKAELLYSFRPKNTTQVGFIKSALEEICVGRYHVINGDNFICEAATGDVLGLTTIERYEEAFNTKVQEGYASPPAEVPETLKDLGEHICIYGENSTQLAKKEYFKNKPQHP